MLEEQSLAAYKAVFDKSPVAFAILELQTGAGDRPEDIIFRYVNAAFAALEGFNLEELTDKAYSRMLHRDSSWLQTFAVTATTGRATHFSLLHPRLNRGLPQKIFRQNDYQPKLYGNRYLHVDCFQLQPGICGCLLTDISIEGNMSQQLLLEHESFEAALNSTGLHHWVYDIQHDRSLQSMSSQRELGVPAVMENYPQSFLDTGMILPKYWSLYLNLHKQVREGAREVSGEYQIWPKSEPFPHWEQLVYRTVFDENGQPVKAVGTALDVSARKYLEERYQDFLMHHRRVLETRTDAFRINITKDTIMPMKDQMGFFKNNGRMTMNQFFSLSSKNIQDPVELRRYKKLFNQESLLAIYKKGIKQADLICHYDMPGAGKRWLRICVDMTRNPANRDIIGVSYTEDKTEDKLNELALKQVIGDNFELMLRVNVRTGCYVVFVYEGTVQQVTKKGEDILAYLKLREHNYLGLSDKELSLESIWKRLVAKSSFCAYYEVRNGYESHVKKLQFYLLDQEAGQFCIGRSDVTYELYGVKV